MMRGPGNVCFGVRLDDSLSAAVSTLATSSRPLLSVPHTIGLNHAEAYGQNHPWRLARSVPPGATVLALTVETWIVPVVVPVNGGLNTRPFVALSTLAPAAAIKYCYGRSVTALCWSGTFTIPRWAGMQTASKVY